MSRRHHTSPRPAFRRDQSPAAARALAAAFALGAAVLACAPQAPRQEPGEASAEVRTGGRIVVALRAEPRTLNPALAPADRPSSTVAQLMNADLIHLDHATQESEPALAESWALSPDGLRFTLELRRGVLFSDGEPFDADDVVFTFQVLLDEEVGAPHRGQLIVGGEPIRVRKLDRHRVEIELAKPYAPAEGLFDTIPILPEHRLGEAYGEGRFAEAWGLDVAGGELAGLGPFQLGSYRPGEQLVLKRNPRYWKVDAEGRRLPYLDELVFVFVATEDAQVVRFQTGETHLIDRVSAESFHLLERAGSGDYELRDVGPSLDLGFLFFNLNDVDAEKLPEVAKKQAWFTRTAFRQAVSAAIDREAIVRLVYQGRASAVASYVTAGNKRWRHEGLAPPRRSLDRARELLTQEGFVWDDDGRLRDSGGARVEFSIVTSSSNSQRLQMATVLHEDLRQLGLEVRVVPLEFRVLVDRLLTSFDYEACILGFTGNLDPDHFTNMLHSGGNNHLWRLSSSTPQPAWQEELDRLTEEQAVALDPAARKELYDRAQAIVAAEKPLILLASPNVLVGASRDVGNFTPTILDHPTLWNAEELFWRGEGSSTGR